MSALRRRLAQASLILLVPLSLVSGARAGESDKIEARVGAWGRNCKNAIAARFKAPSMADVEVSLAETLRSSIDAGEITLADIERDGLSYNFRVHHVAGKDPSGYCSTDGQGNVDDLKAVH
jgi:hypothetical protein